MSFKIEQAQVARRITLVAALGYFVDVFDIILFNAVKNPSLTDLGAQPDALFGLGLRIQNWQVAGLLIGGLLWGILGDKRGRLSVLFGSIITYSLANLLNVFVEDLAGLMPFWDVFTWYSVLRLLAGIGLAGELGAGVTLVAETMARDRRGLGTMIITAVGVLGGVTAAIVGKFLDWQTAYLLGGIMGLFLLFLRAGTLESEMFERLLYNDQVQKGNLALLLTHPKRLSVYIRSILIGLPVWFAGGIVMPNANFFERELQTTAPIHLNDTMILFYIGLSMGDISSGSLSQFLRSRRKALLIFLAAMIPVYGTFFAFRGYPVWVYGVYLFLMGYLSGYWAVFNATASELFGTNLRSTVSNSVPNIVRGMLIPMVFAFETLMRNLGGAKVQAAAIVGFFVILVAIVAAWSIEETFDKDLNYVDY